MAAVTFSMSQYPASALTLKLATGCSFSVLHYRPNAASPVPVESFSTNSPCPFPHFNLLVHIPSK